MKMDKMGRTCAYIFSGVYMMVTLGELGLEHTGESVHIDYIRVQRDYLHN